MQFKVIAALTALAAVAVAKENATATNGTAGHNASNTTNGTGSPTHQSSGAAALSHLVNAGAVGAVVAGGIALVL